MTFWLSNLIDLFQNHNNIQSFLIFGFYTPLPVLLFLASTWVSLRLSYAHWCPSSYVCVVSVHYLADSTGRDHFVIYWMPRFSIFSLDYLMFVHAFPDTQISGCSGCHPGWKFAFPIYGSMNIHQFVLSNFDHGTVPSWPSSPFRLFHLRSGLLQKLLVVFRA